METIPHSRPCHKASGSLLSMQILRQDIWRNKNSTPPTRELHLSAWDRLLTLPLFLDNLTAQLKSWRADNEQIILCIDLNEHSLTGKLSRHLRSDDIELFEKLYLFWPNGTEPNTHVEGSKPIDGIFTTPDIELTACLLLSFHESAGDHPTMIFEVTTTSAIGKFQGKIVRPSSRCLTLRQPGAVQTYNANIHEQFELHKIPQRLNDLLQESELYTYSPPDSFRNKCENLYSQIADIRIYPESNCRKILKPALEFSPTTQYWYDRAHAYQLLIRIKNGKLKKYTDVSRAIWFAARKQIPDPRHLTLQQCEDGLLACRQRQKELKNVSASLRRKFQSTSSANANLRSDTIRE